MCKSVEVVEVIRVITTEGTGEKHNPFKEVVQYWSKDGRFLFKENVNQINNIHVEFNEEKVDEIMLFSKIKRSELLYG